MAAGELAVQGEGVDGGVAGADTGRGEDPVDPVAVRDQRTIAVRGRVLRAAPLGAVSRVHERPAVQHRVVDRVAVGGHVEVTRDDAGEGGVQTAEPFGDQGGGALAGVPAAVVEMGVQRVELRAGVPVVSRSSAARRATPSSSTSSSTPSRPGSAAATAGSRVTWRGGTTAPPGVWPSTTNRTPQGPSVTSSPTSPPATPRAGRSTGPRPTSATGRGTSPPGTATGRGHRTGPRSSARAAPSYGGRDTRSEHQHRRATREQHGRGVLVVAL